MPSLFAIATPLALLLPLLGQGNDDGRLASLSADRTLEQSSSDKTGPRPLPLSSYPESRRAPAPLDAFRDGQTMRQVRIERRMIVRISPRRTRDQNELLAQLPQPNVTTRLEERAMEKCVPVGRIAGVQTGSGNRLMLFMRDARIVSINLEKACRARDFYSGFYVEKNADGQLCVDRDKLQSRSGAKCEVERMRQLVVVKD